MIIKRLYIENWKSFPQREFVFERGINLIQGTNFSGKTSFIQALYFGLFRDSLFDELSINELKKEGKSEGKIEIDLENEDEQYRIRRNFSGDKVVRMDSYLYKLEKGQEVEEIESISRKDEILTKVEEIFNSSREFIKNVNFIQEGSIYYFLNNPTFKINQDIDSILKLDYLRKLNDYTARLIKELDNERKDIEDQVQDFEDYSEKNQGTLQTCQNNIKELKGKKKFLEENLEGKKDQIDHYEQIEQLKSQKRDLTSKIDGQKQSMELISSNINTEEEELKELEEKEEKVKGLRDQNNLYKKNKKNLSKLQEDKDELQTKINKLEKRKVLLKDRRNRIKNLEEESTELKEKIKNLERIDSELAPLKSRIEEYKKQANQLETIKLNISGTKNIITKFKKGKCPISKEACPVASDIIKEKEVVLEELKEKKEMLKEKLETLKNPEGKYNELKEEKEEVSKKEEKLKEKEREIYQIREEVSQISEQIKSYKSLKEGLEQIREKIERLSEANDSLEKKHSQFIGLQERLKDKQKITKKLAGSKAKLEEKNKQITELQKDLEEVGERIRRYIEKHNLEEKADLSQKRKEKESLSSEISKIERKIQENEFKIKQFEEKRKELLKPYLSEAEMRNALEELVHNKYRIIFFQDSLEETLSEIRGSKLRAIKQLCNKMWVKFKKSSQMNSIEWDEKFVPVVQMGGVKRNIYQLSASEKIMIYFSIRASFLAELGPNCFLIVDNLLNPFMEDNQEIILDLLDDIISTTDIEQIIFTGFDISPAFKCQKKIIL